MDRITANIIVCEAVDELGDHGWALLNPYGLVRGKLPIKAPPLASVFVMLSGLRDKFSGLVVAGYTPGDSPDPEGLVNAPFAVERPDTIHTPVRFRVLLPTLRFERPGRYVFTVQSGEVAYAIQTVFVQDSPESEQNYRLLGPDFYGPLAY